jgi:hypothetical protein
MSQEGGKDGHPARYCITCQDLIVEQGERRKPVPRLRAYVSLQSSRCLPLQRAKRASGRTGLRAPATI